MQHPILTKNNNRPTAPAAGADKCSHLSHCCDPLCASMSPSWRGCVYMTLQQWWARQVLPDEMSQQSLCVKRILNWRLPLELPLPTITISYNTHARISDTLCAHQLQCYKRFDNAVCMTCRNQGDRHAPTAVSGHSQMVIQRYIKLILLVHAPQEPSIQTGSTSLRAHMIQVHLCDSCPLAPSDRPSSTSPPLRDTHRGRLDRTHRTGSDIG
mmetsp:Transcript_11329/g.22895  ORF Transcript_11329/g.22895 Transcript_11329/m.22895 type:complete len:212 (+) Transcript_11329:344-979(+)